MTLSYDRHLKLAGTYNVRDLGGYPLADGTATAWRAMLRADGLHGMTEQSIAELVDLGVRTIIDLRGPHELESAPNPFAGDDRVRYHNIALFDALAPIEQMDTGFDMAARYCDGLDQCGGRLAQVLSIIAEAEDGLVLFHCTAGKDRTGIVAALVLLAAGVGQDVVIEDYALTANLAGPLLAKLRASAIARGGNAGAVDRVLGSAPATMGFMLKHLESRYGGVQSYLTHIGVSTETVQRVVGRLAVG